MTKADIVNAVYTDAGGGYSKKESADLVDDVFETMKETLARGEKIVMSAPRSLRRRSWLSSIVRRTSSSEMSG